MSIKLRPAFARVARDKTVFVLLVVALGLALGAGICALGFAHLVVMQPLPYPEQSRLVIAEQLILDQGDSANSRDFSYPAVALLQQSAREVFSASVVMDIARDVMVSHPAQPLVSVNYVSGDYATLFAPPMALGRFPLFPFPANAKSDVGGAAPVAVISFSAWQSLFDLRPDVLGKSVRTAAGVDFEVVGVTAAGFVEPEFNGPGNRTSVWLPWQFNVSPKHWGWAATTDTLIFAGRLAPGVGNLPAAERLSVLLAARWSEQVASKSGAQAGWSTRVELSSAQRAIAGKGLDVGLLMLAGTLGLILVVLVSVIHLLVAKVAQREREFSIQLALGAQRSHLFVVVVADMLLLMLPAAALALAVTAAGFALMQRYLQTLLPRVEELSIGLWTVTLTLSSAVVLAMAIATIALASIGRSSANSVLKAGRGDTAAALSRRLRGVLMASQIAVAGLLIAFNLGLLREATKVLNEPSVNLERSASAFLYQSSSAAQDTGSQGKLSQERPYAEIKRRLLDLSGVEQVSQSHSPLQDFIRTAVVSTRSGAQFPVELKRIDPEYLEITGQSLAAGRNFTAAEIRGAANVVLINTDLARLLERGGEVLGTPLRRGEEAPYVVVGVIDELAYPGASAAARIYLPASEAGSNFIIKYRRGFSLSREQLVALVTRVNPGFGVFLYDQLSAQRSEILLPRRVTAIAASAVALVVILVSGVGLYGMLSYTTRLRRAEIGTRLAFGARASDIFLMLTKSSGVALAIGCLVSVVFAWLVMPSLIHWFDAHVENVRLLDAALAFALLGLLTMLACYLSARPLLSQTPASALRNAG